MRGRLWSERGRCARGFMRARVHACARVQVNGFNFEGTDNGGLDYALNRAISTWYNDPGFFRQLAVACMRLDWSWYGPAQDYIELYYRAMKSY